MKENQLTPANSNGKLSAVPNRRFEPILCTLAACIALVGLGDTIYLTVQHLKGENVECLAAAGCETVLGSSYAAIGKIPLAGFGAAAYFAVFGLATLVAFGRAWATTWYLSLVGAMLGVTFWLLYLQAFILRAFCDFCLLSAALTTALSAIGVAIFFVGRQQSVAPLKYR